MGPGDCGVTASTPQGGLELAFYSWDELPSVSSLGMCFLASDTESRLCSSFAFLFWALQFALVCHLDKPLCLERGSPVLFKKLVSLYIEPRSEESRALPGQLLGVKSFSNYPARVPRNGTR